MKSNVLCASLLAFAFTYTINAVEIIAHRGASWKAPENSLSAVKLGWEEKADGNEFDLWLSKDGKIVVFHDSDTRRFEAKARKISESTWEELQQLDIGGWKGSEYKGEKIPTLESILATVPKGKRAVIEIKCGPEIVPELKRVIAKSGRDDKELAIISFNFETMKAARKAFPKVEHFYLYSYKKDEKTGKFPELDPLIEIARKEKFEGLNLQYTWPIDKKFADKVHRAGLKLLVWTVDDGEVARKLKEAGVDAITTNKPEFIRSVLEK